MDGKCFHLAEKFFKNCLLHICRGLCPGQVNVTRLADRDKLNVTRLVDRDKVNVTGLAENPAGFHVANGNGKVYVYMTRRDRSRPAWCIRHGYVCERPEYFGNVVEN